MPGGSKLQIIPKSGGGAAVTLQFSPEQYTVTTTNNCQEHPNHQGGSPTVQFDHASADELSFECLFDTTGSEDDAGALANGVLALAHVDGERRALPVCDFSWGGLVMTGVITSVTRTFILFDAGGKAKRVRVNLVVKQYVPPAEAKNQMNQRSADRTRTVTVRAGDTLPAIAARCYGDDALWRPIARWNHIDDPARLRAGAVLEIPSIDPDAEAR